MQVTEWEIAAALAQTQSHNHAYVPASYFTLWKTDFSLASHVIFIRNNHS